MRWHPIFPTETATEPTMERMVLLETRPLGIYLHRFHAMAERSFVSAHDHPWDFVSILLRGRYLESRCYGKEEERLPGSVAFRRAKTIHKIVTVPEGALSLCIRGPKRQEWSWKRLS